MTKSENHVTTTQSELLNITKIITEKNNIVKIMKEDIEVFRFQIGFHKLDNETLLSQLKTWFLSRNLHFCMYSVIHELVYFQNTCFTLSF